MFDQSVLHNQVVHFRLAELATELELLRSLLYRTVGECPHLPSQMCFFFNAKSIVRLREYGEMVARLWSVSACV